MRIDDIDTPRNQQGAAQQIIQDLEILGLHWDGRIFYQSDNLARYQDVLDQLRKRHLVYPCTCTRKTLSSMAPQQASVYPGICRQHPPHPNQSSALRLKTDGIRVAFQDRLQGTVEQNVELEVGDFIVQRKDRIIAYQLAVVVDDHDQHVTDVVRGADLLDSTPRQIGIQQLFAFPQPSYMHIPVIVDRHGIKFSKQSRAPAIDTQNPPATLFRLLTLLNQHPPDILRRATVSDILTWAIAHWEPQTLHNVRAIQS